MHTVDLHKAAVGLHSGLAALVCMRALVKQGKQTDKPSTQAKAICLVVCGCAEGTWLRSCLANVHA
eukprot:1149535-Pelagomonas_calceolata.AAC.1